MAKFTRFPNALARKAALYLGLAGGCALAAAGGWAVWLAALLRGQAFAWEAPVALCGLTLAMAVCMRMLLRQKRIIGSGLRGERETARLLAALPAGYHIAVNPRFFNGGRDTELDFVVAGPNGVTIVETKSHSGCFTGTAGGRTWAQHKPGAAAGRYEAQVANPLLQAGVQLRHLQQYLQAQGCCVPVHAAVYFSNPSARLDIRGESNIALLCAGQDDLCAFLRQAAPPGSKPLTPAARARVIAALRP